MSGNQIEIGAYKEGKIVEATDADGFWHKFLCKGGRIHHESNRSYCQMCSIALNIIDSPHFHSELCPNCGQGTGHSF